jgi:hypothetical protein
MISDFGLDAGGAVLRPRCQNPRAASSDQDWIFKNQYKGLLAEALV